MSGIIKLLNRIYFLILEAFMFNLVIFYKSLMASPSESELFDLLCTSLYGNQLQSKPPNNLGLYNDKPKLVIEQPPSKQTSPSQLPFQPPSQPSSISWDTLFSTGNSPQIDIHDSSKDAWLHVNGICEPRQTIKLLDIDPQNYIYSCDREQRKHVCGYCGMSIGRRHDLRRHVNNVHYKYRPFNCNKCSAGFFRKERLKVYVK